MRDYISEHFNFTRKTGSGVVMHLHTWEIVLLVAWVAFSPVVGISMAQFFQWLHR